MSEHRRRAEATASEHRRRVSAEQRSERGAEQPYSAEERNEYAMSACAKSVVSA